MQRVFSNTKRDRSHPLITTKLRALLGGLVGVSLLMGMRYVTLPSGSESSQDVYYHAMMADLGPSVYMNNSFPSLTLSCWRTHFSDKELSFHLFLTGIRRLKRFLHYSIEPPFHFEYLFFAGVLIFSFVAVLVHFKVRHVYLYTIAFATMAPFLTIRLELLRPHLLAMAIILVSCVFFDAVRSWRRIWIPLVFGFIMAWSYSNPHFILLSAFVFAFRELRVNWRLAFAIPMIVILGIVLGFTIHPQFPNTFINWKIQSIDVMMISIFKNAPVKLGYELCPGNFNFFIEHWLVSILLLFNFLFTACFFSRKCSLKGYAFMRLWKNLSDFESLALAFTVASFIAAAGIVAAVRAVEYAVPFLLIATGLNVRLFRAAFHEDMSISCGKWFLRCVVLIVLSTGCFGVFNYSRRMSHQYLVPPLQFADWLSKSDIPQYSVIGNVNWSDFPSLFYVAPNYFYLAGIDPMFAYFAHPEKMSALERFRTGRKLVVPEKLCRITGARYIFVSKRNAKLAIDMYKMGYVAIYQGRDGDLFDLLFSHNYRIKRKK
jgi:hypothetical protein